MTRVLVCGGRSFNDVSLLTKTLDALHKELHITCVIEGEAGVVVNGEIRGGADLLAAAWAYANKVPVSKYPADWAKYGKSAGPIRNRRMVDEGRPDLVVAFPGGKGTNNMIAYAEYKGLEVRKVTS